MSTREDLLEVLASTYGDYRDPTRSLLPIWEEGQCSTGLTKQLASIQGVSKMASYELPSGYYLGEVVDVCMRWQTRFKVLSTVLGPWIAVYGFAPGHPFAMRIVTSQSPDLSMVEVEFLGQLEKVGLTPLGVDLLKLPLPFPEGYVIDQPGSLCHGLFTLYEYEWEPIFSNLDGKLWEDPLWRAERSWAWRFDPSWCEQ